MNESYQDRLFGEFSDAINAAAMRELDRHALTRQERRTAMVQMGKAMILLGSSMVGNAAGPVPIPFDVTAKMVESYMDIWREVITQAVESARAKS